MAVMLEEVYELNDEYTYNWPGVDKYVDCRPIRIVKKVGGNTCIYISIGELNTTYTIATANGIKFPQHSTNLLEYIKEYTLGY